MSTESEKQTIVAYLPVIHRGYLDFFNEFPEADIGILDDSVLSELEHLRKDIRALRPEEAVELLIGIYEKRVVKSVGATALEAINKSDTVILPDDEVSEFLLNTHLKDRNAVKYPVFLRWNRNNIITNIEVTPSRTVSIYDIATELLTSLNDQKDKATNWWRSVSAALVIDGDIKHIGYNSSLPTEYSQYIDGDPRANLNRGTGIEFTNDEHAEAKIIARAAKQGTALDGGKIFVTTFPCPACAKHIAGAGINTVYFMEGYATLDGQEILQSSGVEIVKVVDYTPTDSPRLRKIEYPTKNS